MSQYQVVNTNSIRDLEHTVSELLTQGWKLYGDLVITQDVSDSRIPRIKQTYHQVVVK
jgi:hypothetical protein